MLNSFLTLPINVDIILRRFKISNLQKIGFEYLVPNSIDQKENWRNQGGLHYSGRITVMDNDTVFDGFGKTSILVTKYFRY